MESTEHALAALSLRSNESKCAPSEAEETPSSLPLPPELIIQILGELRGNSDDLRVDLRAMSGDLARCCLVSTAFFEFATPLLYAGVNLANKSWNGERALYGTLLAGRAGLVRSLVWMSNPQKSTTQADLCVLLPLCRGLRDFEWDVMERLDSGGYSKILLALAPLWQGLRSLRIHPIALNGDVRLGAPSLQELHVAIVTFSPGVVAGPPPPYQLQTLTLSETDESPTVSNFDFLTSSSAQSLKCLEYSPDERSVPLDLSPFYNLDELYLYVSQDNLDMVIRTLLATSRTLRSLCLFGGIDPAFEVLFEHSTLLHAIPTGVRQLGLDIMRPESATRYLKDSLNDPKVLPQLEQVTYCHCWEREDEVQPIRLESKAWMGLRRPSVKVGYS